MTVPNGELDPAALSAIALPSTPLVAPPIAATGASALMVMLVVAVPSSAPQSEIVTVIV